MTPLSLAGEFPQVARDDWLRRVDAVLRGQAFSERLVSTTGDGLRIDPLYGQVHGPRAARPQQSPWTVVQRADHPNPAKANAQALEDLSNGTTGLALVAAGSPGARGFGLDTGRLASVLRDIELHAIALRVDGAGSIPLAGLIAKRPIDPERMDICFAAQSVGNALSLNAQGFAGPLMEADGRIWHDQGASEAQELGATLAVAVARLRSLDRLNDVQLVRAVGVTLAANQDMFLTLAKFRAMRLLWERVLCAAGLPEAPLRLHGETSWRMMAALDPHTNILRATAAVFGAGLGGADSICVLPFSLAQGLPNGFARRVARNVQSVLLEESNLWRVADPASGAGYVEDLTSALCDRAWTVFQKAEAGDWPRPGNSTTIGLPVIGTSAYRLPTEYPAEVEAL